MLFVQRFNFELDLSVIGIDICIINKPMVLPAHHMTEQIWFESVCVFVCMLLSRMSEGLLSCCCSFISVTGIIDTPTHQQTGGQAVHMLLLLLLLMLSLEIHRSTCRLSLAQNCGLCVCRIGMILSIKMILFLF